MRSAVALGPKGARHFLWFLCSHCSGAPSLRAITTDVLVVVGDHCLASTGWVLPFRSPLLPVTCPWDGPAVAWHKGPRVVTCYLARQKQLPMGADGEYRGHWGTELPGSNDGVPWGLGRSAARELWTGVDLNEPPMFRPHVPRCVKICRTLTVNLGSDQG